MKSSHNSLLVWMGLVAFFVLNSCTDIQPIDYDKAKGSRYVGPSINYKGQFRKGYVRQPVSTKPNAVKRQNQARYYRKTHARRK